MLKFDGYNHKKGIVYKNQYHVVFCPKYRRKVLINGVDVRLKEILYETAKDNDIVIKSVEVMPDYVHIFIDINPQLPVHTAIRVLKGRSSRLLRDEFPWLKSKIPSLWTRSYFCCTVGHINEATVQRYIEEQKNK